MTNTNLSQFHINSDRFQADFEALAQFGSTRDGGVDRPTFGEAHLAARRWFRERILASGLEFHLDEAGNHSAVIKSHNPSAPILLLGSHLDSVPKGGRFDGALGVLAGLEVLRTVKEAGLLLPVNLEAIDFTDEEGTLVGLLGSGAITGKLTLEELRAPACGLSAFQAALVRAGLTEDGFLHVQRDLQKIAAYLELHIEQGPHLEKAGVDIGVVTSIVGFGTYHIEFRGRADHAGTSPMSDRQDAGLGASAFQLAARQRIVQDFPDCVMNIGIIQYEPGAFNIVPARANLSLEFRAPFEERLGRLEAALLDLAHKSAREYGLEVEASFLSKHSPSLLSPVCQAAIQQAAQSLGLKTMQLPSGAFHDAQLFTDICPTGMIFVPSVAGASHSSREFTRWEDCIQGANVLLQAALHLAMQD